MHLLIIQLILTSILGQKNTNYHPKKKDQNKTVRRVVEEKEKKKKKGRSLGEEMTA